MVIPHEKDYTSSEYRCTKNGNKIPPDEAFLSRGSEQKQN
jgi:hypothetical protein